MIQNEEMEDLVQQELSSKYLLTVPEAMEYFNLGRDTLYRLAKNPKNAFVLFNGKKVLFKRVAFEEYLNSRRFI